MFSYWNNKTKAAQTAVSRDLKQSPVILSRSSFSRTYNLEELAVMEWCGTCIRRRSSAIAALDWNVHYKGDIIENHWLVDLLKRPNAYYSNSDFFSLINQYLDIFGISYVLVVKDSKGMPAALFVLPTQNVKPNMNGGFGILNYEYREAGRLYTYEVDEIIRFVNVEATNSISSMINGVSLASRALESIKTNVSISDYIQRYFENDGIPPLVLESGQDQVDSNQFDEFKSNWNAILPKSKIMAALFGGSKVVPLNGSQNISANGSLLPELDKISRQNIAAVFGIAVSKITAEHNNKATAEIVDIAFRTDTIEPLAYKIEEVLTNYFSQFDPDIAVKHKEYIYTDIELDIKDREHRLSYGLTNRNEEREKLGLGEVEFGDKYYMKKGMFEIKEDSDQGSPIDTDMSDINKSAFDLIRKKLSTPINQEKV